MSVGPKYVFDSADDIETRPITSPNNLKRVLHTEEKLGPENWPDSEYLAWLFRNYVVEPDYSTISADEVNELTIPEIAALRESILTQ